MQVYRYWARARCDADGTPNVRGDFVGVGWSDVSEADATERAFGRAQHTAEAYRSHTDFPEREDYYADRPPREPIVDELRIGENLVAAVTRNVYGAYILNAAETMFIDIDTEAPANQPTGGFLGRLLGKRPEPVEDDTPARVRQIVSQHAGLALRLYKTAAGYRGLVTSAPFVPTSSQAMDLLNSFGSDRLYVQLCKSQSCFRARLTPKPWRCGLGMPPRGYPWSSDFKRQMFDDWNVQYERAIEGYTTCQFLESIGGTSVHEQVAPVLDWHDRIACGGGETLA